MAILTKKRIQLFPGVATFLCVVDSGINTKVLENVKRKLKMKQIVAKITFGILEENITSQVGNKKPMAKL
jgi:hypothetical protein